MQIDTRSILIALAALGFSYGSYNDGHLLAALVWFLVGAALLTINAVIGYRSSQVTA